VLPDEISLLEASAAEAGEPESDLFVFRVAVAYLSVAHETADDLAVLKDLEASLDEDARVTDLLVPNMDSEWSGDWAAYLPPESRDDEAGILDASRHIHAQHYSQPIAFRIHAPKKNQPKVFEGDVIPTRGLLRAVGRRGVAGRVAT
jgi:hypothetical protein